MKQVLNQIKFRLLLGRESLIGTSAKDLLMLRELEKAPSGFPTRGNNILITSFPKSASTFLEDLIARASGYKKVDLCYDRQNEQDLYRPKLIDYCDENVVSKLHARATPANVSLIQKFGLKTIVLTRDIFDVVISLYDHIEQEPYLPYAHISKSEYFSWDRSHKVDFIISYILPWYFHFLMSWKAIQKEGLIETLWANYEELVASPKSVISDVLSFCDIPFREDGFGRLISSVDGSKTRFNKGINGRGKRELRQEHIQKIEHLASFYQKDSLGIIGIQQGNDALNPIS